MRRFEASRLKIEWANKHISNVHSMVVNFTRSDDFYSVSIDYDAKFRTNEICIDVNTSHFPGEDIALTIGDALHNLRSALDLLWYEVVSRRFKWTRFPIRDTRDKLVAPINGALEQQQITDAMSDFVLDTIKPYQAGNYPLWALDDLNIRDKHQLLVPVLQLMNFDGIRLENDKGLPVHEHFWIADESFRARLREADNTRVTVKDKGYATGTILFDLGVPFEGEAVIPSLHRISEEVSRTIEAFELFLVK